ncbi:MAG: sigma-70 family RNA polymerase sigma factor [Kiloniellales bacterium]
MTLGQDSTSLALFMTHRTALLNYANDIVGERSLAEDVVQDAYLRLQRAERRHAADDTLDEPLAYLFRIVRNLALDVRQRLNRERGRLIPGDVEGTAEIPADRPDPESQAIDRDQLRLLQTALDELPRRSRVALEMHRFGDYRIADIAAHLGVSVGTAHALVVDALDHCKSRLGRRS